MKAKRASILKDEEMVVFSKKPCFLKNYVGK